MFERFTDQARRALVVAQEEARAFGHGRITSGHLLLALTEAGAGIAPRALSEAGVDVRALRARVASSMPADAGIRNADRLPFSAGAKKGLELSLREALRLGDRHIGTEHLLLGILRNAGSDDVGSLLGVPVGQVRSQVVALLSGAGARAAISPALGAAMDRARTAAGMAQVTSGQLLAALVDDDDCQATRALRALGATRDAVHAALGEVPVDGTSDEDPRIRPIEVKVGDTSVTVTDTTLAARVRSARPEEVLRAFASYFHEPRAGSRAGSRAGTRTDEQTDGVGANEAAERFTERARRVLVLAQDEARVLRHSVIGTEHILLGLIHEGQGLGAKALELLGVSLAGARDEVDRTTAKAGSEPCASPPFTPRAKKVLELSQREAAQLGHTYIGTEHLLLGILSEGDGVAVQVLVRLGVERERLREEVVRLVTGGTGPGAG